MYERAMGFNDFVQYYSLERAEGVLLRYLSDAYKALRHTIPDTAVTDELDDIIEWLGELVRQTDSSLVDEWEKLARRRRHRHHCRRARLRRGGRASRRDKEPARLPRDGAQRPLPPSGALR